MVRSGRCIVTELGTEGAALSTVSKLLGEVDVTIHGFSAQAGEPGEAFVVTEDADQAREALEEAGLTVRSEDYVAATLTSRPGELGRAMAHLTESGVRPEAAFLVRTPWGPDIQVAFVGVEPASTEKVLEEIAEG